MNAALDAFKLTFQVSPIILTGGIATGLPHSMLPIIALTEAANFVDGILSGGRNISLDDFFGAFEVVPGGTLIAQEIAKYPSANQFVAANAVIAQPLTVSMRMVCPVRNTFGYPLKLAIMTNLATVLAQHNSSGGTYTIATPSYFYVNALMTKMSDLGGEDSAQKQVAWQFDFEQPLLTLAQVTAAQNALMSKFTGQTMVTPNAAGEIAWSSPAAVVGAVSSVGAASVIPSASGAGGAGVAGILGNAIFGGVF